MPNRSTLIRSLRPFARRHPVIHRVLRGFDQKLSLWHHSAASRFPALIRPAPRQITIAITAQCNLLCRGCRYGRDFMVGERLPLETVKSALGDARAAGVNTARFFGGEPLLHPDLPAMIRHAAGLGLDAYITTNGTLLEKRIDELVPAGLRWMTIGFYGIDGAYDEYTQRPDHFRKLIAGLEAVRGRHGDAVEIQLNWVLSQSTCHLDALRAAWDLARRYELHFSVDPISRSIPFFRTEPDPALQFAPEHRPRLEGVVAELVRLKEAHPERMPQSETFLRALPDLLLTGIKVPCDAYQLIWVGADGTVQLCDTWFKLGNLHERPLREMLFGEEHCRAARDGFRLACPDCFCKIDSRIRKHAPALRRYGS